MGVKISLLYIQKIKELKNKKIILSNEKNE